MASNANSFVYPIANGELPAENGRGMQVIVDWEVQNGTPYTGDFYAAIENGAMSMVQSIFIDNSTVGNQVSFTLAGSNQTISIPANAQAILPVFSAGTTGYTVTGGDFTNQTKLAFLNMPLPAAVWNSAASGGAVQVQGQVSNAALSLQPNHPTTFYVSNGGALRTTIDSRDGLTTIASSSNAAATRSISIAGAIYSNAPVTASAGNANGFVVSGGGSIMVSPDSGEATYSAAFRLACAATPTDIFMITGSGTKIVRVQSIMVSFDSTGGGSDMDCQFIRRSTLNTGGTSTSPTPVPHDTLNFGASATLAAYTANPTALGTSLGAIERFFVGASANSGNPTAPFKYGPEAGNQPINLRGINDALCISLAGGTVPTGLTANLRVRWTET